MEIDMTGILAVQGDFEEHAAMLARVGEECFEIRQKSDLDRPFDRLILPGGESTVQEKLIKNLGMYDIIKKRIEDGTPVLATCAGLILLAREVANDDRRCFMTLPVTVRRNAYGRQLGSFRTYGKFGEFEDVPMEFIRAPYVEAADDEVEIMSVTDGKITAVRYKNQLALAYHPELCGDTRVFEYFLSI